jgi:NAD(P)-dependent dehydrogenase (short-subunit alcohol dehydrogenase family)/acyl carrier protein
VLKAIDLHQGNANTLPDWFYRRVWRPSEAVTRLPGREGACLLFLDGGGLGARIGEELQRSGRRCVRVEAGTASVRLGPAHFQLAVDEPGAYRWLLETLFVEGLSPALVLHLWTFRESRATSREDSRALGLFSLLRMSQALVQCQTGEAPLRVQVISQHAQPTRADETVDCDLAPLLGLVQTLPQEVPWLDVRHLDLPLAPTEENAARVLAELEVVQREREVAYRQGLRLVPRLEKVALAAMEKTPLPFAEGGLYLLSGGLGAIGTDMARRLLTQYRARLVLIGRTRLFEPGSTGPHSRHEELRGLAAQSGGGEVVYEDVDVCDLAGLRQAVSRAETRWGRPLSGVVHLAGILSERLLMEESVEHLAEVLRPKVEGTRVLSQLLEDRPEAFFIGFSSVNATSGGVSAGAYSAANRFLEHFTHEQRRTRASRHVCLAWSWWEKTGPARPEEVDRLARRRGYQAVSPSRGWASLLAALGRQTEHLLIGLDARSPSIRARLEHTPPQTSQLRAVFTALPGTPPVPEVHRLEVRDRLGTRVPCEFRQVERLVRTPAGALEPSLLEAGTALSALSAPERVLPRNEVEHKVVALWQEILGVEDIGVLDNFFELGGHSMLMARLQGRLARAFDREVPMLELFRHPTVRALSAYLADSTPARTERHDIDERARKQRAAHGRNRLRHALPPKKSERDK